MPGACCDMGASTTLDKAQILKSGCTLADAAQACALAATWRALQHGCERRPKQAQILQSPLMLAGAEWPGSTGDPWRVSSMRPCSGRRLCYGTVPPQCMRLCSGTRLCPARSVAGVNW